MKKIVKKGQIYYVDLGEGVGSELQKVRPCIVVQNNIGNRHSPTTIVCPITHRSKNLGQPTQVEIKHHFLEKNFKKIDGVIMAEQIRTVCKSRLNNLIGNLNEEGLKEVDKALKISLGLQ